MSVNGTDRVSKVFGLQSSLYRATRSLDGKPYLLRRFENYRLGNDMAIAIIEAWTNIHHGGIVSVREGFTTKAFGDICKIGVNRKRWYWFMITILWQQRYKQSIFQGQSLYYTMVSGPMYSGVLRVSWCRR